MAMLELIILHLKFIVQPIGLYITELSSIGGNIAGGVVKVECHLHLEFALCALV